MTTDRVERLKARLFEVDDRVLFMERMRIVQRCGRKYAQETAGLRFGHTLQELLAGISIAIEEDDLILGRVREELPSEADERWVEAHRAECWRAPWFLFWNAA